MLLFHAGGPGKVSGLTTGNTAAFRASLWMNMEKLVDAMFSSYSQVEVFNLTLAICNTQHISCLILQFIYSMFYFFCCKFKIFQLQKVLTRKRDPASHVLFIDHYKQAKVQYFFTFQLIIFMSSI